MFMSQIRRFISVGATCRVSTDISAGSMPFLSIHRSFTTAKPNANGSNSRFKPSSITTIIKSKASNVSKEEIKIQNSTSTSTSSSFSPPKRHLFREENAHALGYVAIQMNSGRWNAAEKSKFKTKLMEMTPTRLTNMENFYEKLSDAVGSRSVKQCKQHHDYHYKRSNLQA